MCGLGLFLVGSQRQSIKESLLYQLGSEVSSVEVDQLAEGADSILYAFSSLTTIVFEVFRVYPVDQSKGLLERELLSG